MSVEMLREAAALMRERAEAATPGRWGLESNTRFDVETWVLTDGATEDLAYEITYERDARYIASWHPGVALAVAEWLGFYADVCMHEGTQPDPEDDIALAVARAYLGQKP